MATGNYKKFRYSKNNAYSKPRYIRGLVKRLKTLATLAATALACTGCFKLGPDGYRPDSEVACEWNNELSADISESQNAHRAWWREFNDPVLNELIDIAWEQNLELTAACERVREARAELGIATGLQYPQVQSISGAITREQISKNAAPIANLPSDIKDRVDSLINFHSLNFNIAWELDIWGQFKRGVEAAKSHYCSEVAAFGATQVMLYAHIADAYTTLRMLEEMLDVAIESLELREHSLHIAEVRFRNGVVTELDVSQAKSALHETEALVPEVQKGIVHTKNALCVLLAFPPGELDCLLLDGAGIPSAPGNVVTGVPADLLRQRPDVAQAEYNALSACALIGVAQAQLYPHFSLAGKLGRVSANTTNIFDVKSLYWKGGGLIDWDIFNYGRLKNAVTIQESRFRQAVVAYQEKVLQAQAEVEDAFASVASSQSSRDAYSKGAEAAARSLSIASLQYREGRTDYTSVLLAQQALLKQQLDLVDSRAASTAALIQLYRSLGGGWHWCLGEDMISDEDSDNGECDAG